MRKSLFSLRIPAEEYLRVYQGSAKYVVVRDFGGKRIQFNANIIRQFLTREGIFGEFIIFYDDNNKFVKIEKVG